MNCSDISLYLAPKKEYKALVKCLTYNQSKYIQETLNGFVIQKTNFPFVCLVMDDASTDGEQDIIREWMESECEMSCAEVIDIPASIVYIVPHKQNSSCTFAFYFLKNNLHKLSQEKVKLINPWRKCCEYEAVCEGDDYWIDSLKLHKQVTFLDENPDYTMCCTDAIIQTNQSELDWARYNEDKTIPVEDIIIGGGLFIQTTTILFRTKLKSDEEYPDFAKRCHVGDYPLQIYAALTGKVYWFASKMAVYRYQVGNSWTSINNAKICTDNMVKGWQSEIYMLQGMDNLSQRKYHDVFNKRIAIYVFSILCGYHADIKKLTSIFENEIRLLSFGQKLKIYLLKSRFYKFYDLLSKVYHKFVS